MLSDLVSPKLSTIDYPGIKMGAMAAKTLIAQIKQRRDKLKITHETITIPTHCIIRESSLHNLKRSL